MSKKKWIDFASEHKIQGLVLDNSPRLHQTFTCEESGMDCSPRSQSASGLLLPWCCIKSFAQMINLFEDLANQLGMHYELDSGSVLGAVKMGHYIPWDIDGDIYTRLEDFKYFAKPAGFARVAFEKAGFSLWAWSENQEKNTKYFLLSYKGIDIETNGRRGNLTLPKSGLATRAEISGVWVRTHANPGEYARSRYGPGYLRHAQSWRYAEMSDSWVSYQSGHWRECSQNNFHGCLANHPTDGNIDFHPDNFRAWKYS